MQNIYSNHKNDDDNKDDESNNDVNNNNNSCTINIIKFKATRKIDTGCNLTAQNPSLLFVPWIYGVDILSSLCQQIEEHFQQIRYHWNPLCQIYILN